MAQYGLLRGYRLGDTGEDIRGAALYGRNDDKLGKIDDVIFDHSTADIQYVVVDTGGWLKTKKFLVPADRLRPSTKHDHDFSSNLTKEQIENFPAYSESDLDSDDKWTDYEDRYRAKWDTGPVMHREGTDRNITPTTQQLQGNPSSTAAAGVAKGSKFGKTSLEEEEMVEGEFDKEHGLNDEETADAQAASAPTGRVVPAGVDSVVISNSAAGIGPRWDTFQARLRERRKEAVTASVGSADSREPFKKAI